MRNVQDGYFRRAKREGRLARSVYKLEELDRRDRLFRPGGRVLDLGAAPGSWLEYVLEAVGPSGVACAVDLKPIHKKFKGRAHFRMLDAAELLPETFADVASAFDVVVSDMAPRTSGVRIVDQSRSLELCGVAWDVAEKTLRTGGHFVCKFFDGPEAEAFRDGLRPRFRTVRVRKPDACRRESFEAYLVCLHFLGSV